jgi:hypothetical protein
MGLQTQMMWRCCFSAAGALHDSETALATMAAHHQLRKTPCQVCLVIDRAAMGLELKCLQVW